MPSVKTAGSACADCYARLKESVTIEVGKRKLIPLGIAVELPKGYEMQVRPRSGLTSKGIDSGFGTVDSDYRGEVMCCIINNSEEPFTVNQGDRICQIAICKNNTRAVLFQKVKKLSDTSRGKGGFGSTGLKG